MYQPVLSEKYEQMSSEEACGVIGRCKEALSGRMVILGHHYQRDEIIQFADYTGDSLELSRRAAGLTDVEYIVFCGVHFMAESADILTSDDQKVLLPDMTAGCSMADMADIDQVESCWEQLCGVLGERSEKLVPITYVNSTAAIKAFCGERGGLCCTSSNCRAVFEWVWGRDPESVILFMPDEHLGRNTAYGMGVGLESMGLWDPYEVLGGLSEEAVGSSRVILWKGNCSVHQGFTAAQIEAVRAADDGVKVIVHPECCFEVAQGADEVGSTAYIIKVIEASAAGSSWAVGTEINLVNRLAGRMAERGVAVRSLSGTACLCETMYRIDLKHLAWLLEALVEHLERPGEVSLPNRVVVDAATKVASRVALERMLSVTSGARKGRS